MLNLPEPGKATGILANAWIGATNRERDKEDALTKMRANAILQQAQQGNFTDSGYEVLQSTFGSGVADTYKKAAETDKSEKEQQLANMKLEKSLLSMRIVNENVSALEKISKMDTPDEESAKFLTDKINSVFKAHGIESDIKPFMDSKMRQEKVKEANSAYINKFLGAATKNPTPESIAAAGDAISVVGDKIDKDVMGVYKSRLTHAQNMLQKKEEHKQRLAEAKQKYTNIQTGRTEDFTSEEAGKLNPKIWERGGRSENKPDTVINVGNIQQKITAESEAKNKAYLKEPRFRADITKEVINNNDTWKFKSKKEKDAILKREAERTVKNIYPEAEWGIGGKTNKPGWWIKTERGYELVAPWN
jgi:hypothetical protein